MSASKKIFRIKGYFWKDGKKVKFTKELVEIDENRALEKLFSILGGNHRVKRTRIKIEEIREISPEEVTDLGIKQLLMLTQNV